MKLRVQKRALRQIDKILTEIAVEFPQGASNVEARFSEIVAFVRRHPQAGKRTTIPGGVAFF